MEDNLARGLAIAGIVLAAASFGWQVYTWRRSVGRVKVGLEREWIDVTQGQIDVALVTLRNVGRGPVFIQRISFDLQGPAAPIIWEPAANNSGFPHQLATGQAESWRYMMKHRGDQGALSVPLRAIVTLGDGRQAWSSTTPTTFRVRHWPE